MKGPFRSGMRGHRGAIILQFARIAVGRRKGQKMQRRERREQRAASAAEIRCSAYCGQAAPLSTQLFIAATNSGRLSGGSVRPSPGFQPQPTRSSEETCSMICARVRWPFFAGSFSWRQNWPAVSPCITIFMLAGGSDHFGFPGGMLAPGRFAAWWQVLHFIPYTPLPSAPRFTSWMCTCPSSPCKGASPEGWQLRQRGEAKTGHARLKAACAAAVSALAALSAAVDAARMARREWPEVERATCCCASVGRHAAKTAATKSATWAGHLSQKLFVMFAPSPRTFTQNANLPD